MIEDLQKPVDYQFPARQEALSTLYQRKLKREPYFCGWVDYSHQSSMRREYFENPFQTKRIWKHWLYILVWTENTLKMELVRPPCPLQFPITFHGKATDIFWNHTIHILTQKKWSYPKREKGDTLIKRTGCFSYLLVVKKVGLLPLSVLSLNRFTARDFVVTKKALQKGRHVK